MYLRSIDHRYLRRIREVRLEKVKLAEKISEYEKSMKERKEEDLKKEKEKIIEKRKGRINMRAIMASIGLEQNIIKSPRTKQKAKELKKEHQVRLQKQNENKIRIKQIELKKEIAELTIQQEKLLIQKIKLEEEKIKLEKLLKETKKEEKIRYKMQKQKIKKQKQIVQLHEKTIKNKLKF